MNKIKRLLVIVEYEDATRKTTEYLEEDLVSNPTAVTKNLVAAIAQEIEVDRLLREVP